MSIQRIARNDSGGVLILGDLSLLEFATGESKDLLLLDFSLADLSNSEDLRDEILNGNIVINDGTNDLSPEEAIRALEPATRQNADNTVFEDVTVTGGLSFNDATAVGDVTIDGTLSTGTFVTPYSKTYHVDQGGGGDFTTIQAALNACTGGEAIYVHPGTYLEAITFTADNVVVKAVGGMAGTVLAAVNAPWLVNFSTFTKNNLIMMMIK